MKIKRVFVVYLTSKHKKEKKILKEVLSTLEEYSISYTTFPREFCYKHNYKKYDLVIVVGGDGTFLKTSHYAESTPMLGVNSHPERKEGYLMQTTSHNFKRKFKKLMKNGFKIKKVTRLEAKINNKKLPLALNDLFIGHSKPYVVSRFDLKVRGRVEHQKCSGMIISTGIGSNAWATSAGGISLSKYSKKYEYVIREPYQGRLHKHTFLKGVMKPNEKLIIKMLREDSIIAVDSTDEFKLKKNDKIIVKVGKPLNYVII